MPIASSKQRRVIKNAKFDCAVLDINLGGTLSFEIADLLQQRGIPILFCTAYANAATVFAGKGPVACLEKPIQKIELRDALLGVLGPVDIQDSHESRILIQAPQRSFRWIALF
jgi:CheY-like chemotaxis protein